jgi:hypothetical protein
MSASYKFVDDNGQPLKSLDESHHQAVNAVGLQVAKKHTCMIVKETKRPVPVGSGSFVRFGNKTFVATAKHLFEGFRVDELVGIYWGEGKEDNKMRIPVRNAVLDEKLDLAAIPLAFDARVCATSLGGDRPRHPETEPDLFVISGVPAEGCDVDDNARSLSVVHFSLGLIGLPPRLWPVNPETPICADTDLLLNYTRDFASDDRGAPMRQIDPHGLSGGGIWSVPRLGGSIWSPSDARLVAVQSSVESNRWRYLRATKIEHWLSLLADGFPGFFPTSTA